MGMTFKIHAYTTAVGIHLSEYSLLLEFAATALGTLEFILGVYLLLGIHRRLTTRCLALFMLLFTAITVWIYIANPVSDCGCFGDAIKLTNGQTLVKNIVLLACATILVWRPQKLRRIITARNSWIVSIYSWVYAISLALYSLHYLPLLDFTPYKPGANIRAAFSEEPTEDGNVNKLTNFYLADPHTLDDRTFDILQNQGYTFLLTLPSVEDADDGCCDRINDLYDFCRDHQYTFYMATASSNEAISSWIDRTGAAYPILLGEDTELSTMVRSNPGLLLLHDGLIVQKWSNNNLPETDNLKDISEILPATNTHPLGKLIL